MLDTFAKFTMGIIVAVSMMNLSLRCMDRGIDPFLAAAATAAEDQPGATGAGKPSSKQANGPFVMSPGVIVEPAAARLYMMNPQGGIDAVQFDTGKLLWTTQAGRSRLRCSTGDWWRRRNKLALILCHLYFSTRTATASSIQVSQCRPRPA